MRTILFATKLVFASAALCLAQVTISDEEIEIFGSKVHFSELPIGLEKRLPPGLSEDQISNVLSSQPNLTLSDSTLIIDETPGGPTRVLSVNKFSMSEGSFIILDGVQLEFTANEIQSAAGVILSSHAANLRVLQIADDGTSGVDGENAERLIMGGRLSGDSILRIDLSGQDGQHGGRGLAGSAGAPGVNGARASDSLVGCKRGGGNGGPGSAGGTGGKGGHGGNGGNGGELVLRGELKTQRAQISFSAEGGKGGKPGAGGAGGPGGRGGQGGAGSTFCRGGVNGPDGPFGNNGPMGAPGGDGQNGRVTID